MTSEVEPVVPVSAAAATQLYLSKGKKSSKATFHLHGILYMLSPVEDSPSSVDLQLLISKKSVPSDTNVKAHMDLWARLVSDYVRDTDQFDALVFVDECIKSGLLDALKVSQKKVTALWTTCKTSPAFNRVTLHLGHRFTTSEMHKIGDESLRAFFTGRWYELHPVGTSLLLSIFDLLETDVNAYLRLAAESLEVLNEVLDLVNEQPLVVAEAPVLAHRLKRTASFFPSTAPK
ncbi:hypothetical protein HDU83_000580 [Entophlyctis luteolus]|nr:hypothetical protein HDU83_000580 [Entophlyctis luteolus]